MLHLCIPVTCKCINTFHMGWINGPLSGAVYHILIQSFNTSADAIRILTSFQIGLPPAYLLENAVVKIGKPYHDVIKWKHFPCYWPFVWGIHRSSVNSPYKGQWRGALVFPVICAWINGWVNNREAGDDVTVMYRSHETGYCLLIGRTGMSKPKLMLER